LLAPWWTNEAMWLARRFAEEVLETSNVLAVAPSVLSSAAARFRSDGCYDDLDRVDAVFLVGTDLTGKYPVLAVRTRQAVRKGVGLAIVGRGKTGLEDISSATFRPRKRASAAALLKALARGGSGGARDLRRLWGEAGRKLVVADLDRMGRGEVAALEELRARFAGEVVVLGLRGESNAQGAVELSLADHEHARRLISRCRSGKVGAMVLLGLGSTDGAPIIRLREKPDFLAVVDAAESALTSRADVVLPGAYWMEDEGTLINPEGRLQRVVPALAAPGGRANWETVAELAKACGSNWDYEGAESVFEEMSRQMGWEVSGCEDLSPWGVLLAREEDALEAGRTNE